MLEIYSVDESLDSVLTLNLSDIMCMILFHSQDLYKLRQFLSSCPLPGN